MDGTEHEVAVAVPKPYGYRLVVSKIPEEDKKQIFIPEGADVDIKLERAVVVDGGEQSGLEAGTVVHYSGRPAEVNGYLVLDMGMLVAWEPA